MTVPKDDWKPVSLIMDSPTRTAGLQTIAREITDYARDYSQSKKRTAAGVSSILDFGGPAGSSIPSVLAQNSAISSFLYSLSRADKLQLFRYWDRHDTMVGRALDLHTELPMSRITIGPPKGPSPRQNKDIKRIYESMCERIGVMELLPELTREYHMVGDVYLWCSWNPDLLEYDEVYCLPVEYVHSIIHPFNRKKEIIFFAKPLVDTAAVRRITDRDLYMVCFVPWTGITLEDGTQKKIELMEKGDIVLSGDGHYKKVLDVGFREIDEEIVRISARGLRDDLYVTCQHKLHTSDGKIPADQVREGGYLLAAPDHSEIPQNHINDNRCWLMGWYLAEGYSRQGSDTSKGEIVVVFNLDDERHFAERFAELVEIEFLPETQQGLQGCLDWQEVIKTKTERWKNWKVGKIDEVALAGYTGCCTKCNAPNHYLRLKGNKSKYGDLMYSCRVCMATRYLDEKKSKVKIYEAGSVWSVGYSNRAAYNFFVGEAGRLAENKKLKNYWLTLPKDQQRILWDCYFEGDGHYRKHGGRGCTSVSPDLRDQMYWISARLGYNPRTSCWYDRDNNSHPVKMSEMEAREITAIKRIEGGKKPDYKLDITSISLLGKETDAMGRRVQLEPVVDGKIWMRVLSTEKIPYQGSVFNICIEDDHTYHANGAAANNSDSDIERLYEALGDSVPEELKEALNYGEAVPLSTSWKHGSYCKHVYRNRPPNEEYGVSLLERCMDTLLRLENLKNANFSISSRNMSPKHLVAAPGISKSQLDDLRAQLDLSFLETADYSIVTNYEVIYQLIGASDRLLNTDSEYQTLRQDLAAGLGTTIDMLTGAASYGGQRITLEMMNTSYLCLRDKVKNFVEKDLFRPIAFAKGHYFEEEIEMWPRVRSEDIEEGDILIEERDGHLRRKRNQVNVMWLHSTLRFNRVSIRDNAEVYDQLFQLHQKGSLAVRYLLDLHNIDPEENSQAMLEDIGTPKDSVFNDFIRALYTATDVPQKIISQTDFVDRIMRGLRLGYKQQPQPGMGGGGMGGGMGGGLSDLGGGLGGGMGGGLGGGMGGGMPGLGTEPGMAPGGAPGDTGAVPGGPEAGGSAGAAAAPVASSRGRRRTAAQVRREQEISGPSLPGRVLSSKTSEVLRKVAQSKHREGAVLSSKEVKSLVRAIETEEEKRENMSTKNKKRL